jgi:F0F1-type ATP synthase assembly protein I
MQEKEKKDKGPSVTEAMFAMGDGVLGAAILIVLGIYGGQFLDHKFNTGSWLTGVLPLVGGGLGLVRLVVKAINLDKDKVEDET